MEAAESLFQCLEEVLDPGMAREVRHPFRTILRLTPLGLVCGQTTIAHMPLFAVMNCATPMSLLGSSGTSTPLHHHLAHPDGGLA